MGTSLERRIDRHTSKPSMPGSMMSINTTSAGSAVKRSSASSPVSDSSTTQPSSSRAILTAVRMRSSSSTARLRVPTAAWCLIQHRKPRHFPKFRPPAALGWAIVVDPEELLDIAERLAMEAADLLVRGVEQRPSVGGDGVLVKSSPTDHATEWDHAAERLV